MAFTDILTFVLSFFFLARGASRGFMRSLTGPFSIIVGTLISMIYYRQTGHMAMSVTIGLLAPLLLSLVLKLFLNMQINPLEGHLPIISRLSGAVITLSWGWAFIAFTLVLLSLIPPLSPPLTAVRDDVTKSISYAMVKPWSDLVFPLPQPNMETTKNQKPSPAGGAAAAQSLAQDPRFQKVLQDPEVQKEIQSHDIMELMKNSKMMDLVQQIMSDPATMKKVLSVYSSQTAANH